MKKISLSSFEEKTDSTREEYQLDPTEEYVINFEEELKKFKPSLEVEDIENAVYQEDLSDMTDILREMMDQKK